MAKNSITLVGRSSHHTRHAEYVSFLLTVKVNAGAVAIAVGYRPELVVECRGHRGDIIELFETMDEGSLVGIISTLQPIKEQYTHPIVQLDRLEILGKPVTNA